MKSHLDCIFPSHDIASQKESFERMRRDHGEILDSNDNGPVGVSGTPPPPTRTTTTTEVATDSASAASTKKEKSSGNVKHKSHHPSPASATRVVATIETRNSHNSHKHNHTSNTFQGTTIPGSTRGNTNDGKPGENQQKHAVDDDASLRTSKAMSSDDKPYTEEQGTHTHDTEIFTPVVPSKPDNSNIKYFRPTIAATQKHNNAGDGKGRSTCMDGNHPELTIRGSGLPCGPGYRKVVAVPRREGSKITVDLREALTSNKGPLMKKVLPPPRIQKEKDITIEHQHAHAERENRQEVEAAAAANKASTIQQQYHPEATEGSSQAAKGAANANAAVSETTENQAEQTGANSREFVGAEHQAAGCGTGEEGHNHKHHNHNNKMSPQGNNDGNVMGGSSQKEIQTNTPSEQGNTIHLLRKRKRNFICEPPARTKRPAADQNEESPAAAANAPKVNTSNWGKLQALFRWSSPPPPQNAAPKPNPSGPTNPEESQTGAAESERKSPINSMNTTSSSNSPSKRGGLEPMPHILVSPYEGNRSAEIGEEPLEEWKDMMKPLKRHERNGDDDGDDVDDDGNAMNPLLSKLYGDPLALTIFKARSVIARLDPLYETSWKGGKIGGLNLGWIPKRQLLLCLSEDKIGAQSTTKPITTTSKPMPTTPVKGGRQDGGDERDRESDNDEDTEDDENSHSDDGDDETEALQRVVRKLECFKLVLAAIKEWKLKYDYPELYSRKEGSEFAFRKNDENETENEETNLEHNNNHEETKRNCYKCQIFVSRVFATLLLFDKEQKVGPSLLGKVRACLEILNKHVRAHPGELANLLKKKEKMERKAAGELSKNRTTPPKRPREEVSSSPDQKSQHNQTHHRRANKQPRRKIEGTYEEREATLGASFAVVKEESESLLKMMDYYKSRLLLVKVENGGGESCDHHHPCLEAWNEEIAANLEREFAKEERRRKKIALARLRRSRR